jgi:hypothetical protein
VSPFLNPGITVQNPETRAGLNLQTMIAGRPAPTARTFTLVSAGGPGTQPDPLIGAAASLRWPKFGNACAIINRNGNNQNVNSMAQTMTVGPGDVDAHARIVADNPGVVSEMIK